MEEKFDLLVKIKSLEDQITAQKNNSIQKVFKIFKQKIELSFTSIYFFISIHFFITDLYLYIELL